MENRQSRLSDEELRRRAGEVTTVVNDLSLGDGLEVVGYTMYEIIRCAFRNDREAGLDLMRKMMEASISALEQTWAEEDQGKLDLSSVEAPTHLDGTPVDRCEAATLHARLTAGEMKIEITDEVAATMKEAGLTTEDIRKMLLASTRKTMS